MYIRSEREGKIHAGTSLWNMYVEAAASSRSSTDDTLGFEPHCLNCLKQSLVGYGAFNAACRAGGALPLS